MHKLRAHFLLVFAWSVTLLAAYFWGAQRDGGMDKDLVADVKEVTASIPSDPISPEKNNTGSPVDLDVVETVSAGRILANAREKIRSGLFSQKGILRAFNCIQQLDADNVRDAVLELELMDVSDPDHKVLLLAVMGRWAELDGDSAMSYAEGKLSGDLRAAVIENVVGSWSEENPEAALTWYQRRYVTGQLVSWLGNSASGLLTPIYLGMTHSDPEAAFSSMIAIKDEQGFRYAVDGMAMAIIGLKKSEQFLRRIGNLSLLRQEIVHARVLKYWVRLDPEEAAAWVLRMKSSGLRAKLIRQVGLEWATNAPESALQWLLNNAPDEGKADILREAIARWAQSTPNRAATWLRRLTPGPDTDQAIAALAQQIVHRDPEGALSWASTIKSRIMREQTISSVFAQWAIRHPREAAQRLEKTNFPKDQVSKLRLLVAPNLPEVSP